MRAALIVVDSPSLDLRLRVCDRRELVHVQALVAQPMHAQSGSGFLVIELRTVRPLSSVYHADIRKIAEREVLRQATGIHVRKIEGSSVTSRQVSYNPFIEIPYDRYLIRELYDGDGNVTREVFHESCGGGGFPGVIQRLDFCGAKRAQFEGPYRW